MEIATAKCNVLLGSQSDGAGVPFSTAVVTVFCAVF